MKKTEIVEYLNGADDTGLFNKADMVRQVGCGRAVYIRGLIEFSNVCSQNCLYCGLRKDNHHKHVYRMTPDEIIRSVERIINKNIKTVVLQSADDYSYSRKKICTIIKNIKKLDASMAVTLSIGERSFDDYRAFRDNGADRYLLRHETADPLLFAKLRRGRKHRKRLRILEHLHALGYQIGAGSMVGLPWQTIEHIAKDIILYATLQPDMIGIGPFIPHCNTPLSHFPAGSKLLTLRVLALARIVTHDALIPATTALATSDPQNGLSDGLAVGCNVIMVNFTPQRYQPSYSLYDGKETIDQAATEINIRNIDRYLSGERGDSPKKNSDRYYLKVPILFVKNNALRTFPAVTIKPCIELLF